MALTVLSKGNMKATFSKKSSQSYYSEMVAEAPTSKEVQPCINSNTSPMGKRVCSISLLPPEIRCKIYSYYFISHSSIPIKDSDISNQDTTQHFFLTHTSLALSSPYFFYDIPISIFLTASTFTFTSSLALKALPALLPKDLNHPIRKIRIQYQEKKDQDWVFLIYESFAELEEVTFEIGKEVWSIEWWESVKDAVREGWCCGCEKVGRLRGECGRGVGIGRSQRLILGVECLDWRFRETLVRGV